MKKLLLTTAALAAISTSAFADTAEKFYVRGDLDAYSFTKFKTTSKTTGVTTSKAVKIKPKFGVGIDLGAGYYITDSVRAELVLNLPFAQKMKGKTSLGQTAAAPANNATGATTENVSIKHKPTIRALLARVSADVLDLGGVGKVFITAGLGLAQVKDSATVTFTSNTAAGTAPGAPAASSTSKDYAFKAKNKTNVAWTLGFGTAFDVAEGVHLDVTYSYRDYGKSKSLKGPTVAGTTLTLSGNKFASHNLSAGIRFDI